jgi:hypothetical protein
MTTSIEGEDDQHDIHGGGDMSNISFLRSNPYFQRLRQTVHRDPGLLQPLLQQLAQANPRLMEVNIFMIPLQLLIIDAYN